MQYFTFALITLVTLQYVKSTVIHSARIESCASCQLNRLPDVKKFIYEDVPKYENVEFKKIPGAPPELVLLDENDAEVERIKLAPFSREDCNSLLREKGFKSKEVNKEL